MDILDDEELFIAHATLEKQLSTVSHKIKSLLVVPPTSTSTSTSITADIGVKLPKLDVAWKHHPLEAILGPVHCGCTQPDKPVQRREDSLPTACHQGWIG